MEDKIWYINGAGGLGRECFDLAITRVKDVSSTPRMNFLVDEPEINESERIED